MTHIKTNTYGKPTRQPRCTVQLVDLTPRKPKYFIKLTVYTDVATVEKLIRTALEAAGLKGGSS